MVITGDTSSISSNNNNNNSIEEEIIKIEKPKKSIFKKFINKFKKKKKDKGKSSVELIIKNDETNEDSETNEINETNNYNTVHSTVSFNIPNILINHSNIGSSSTNTVKNTSSQHLTVPSLSILNNSLFTAPTTPDATDAEVVEVAVDDGNVSDADTEITLVDPVILAENKKRSKKKKMKKLLSRKRGKHRRMHSWQGDNNSEHFEDPRNCHTVTNIKEILAANNKVELHNEVSTSFELILDDELAMEIKKHIPIFYREACNDWYLEYSLGEHGSSLTTFYECQMDCDSPVVMVITDCYGEVFGAYLNQPFNPTFSGFTGNRECFLWKKTNEGLKVYRATTINEYFMMADQDFIALGVDEKGVFGLFLDNLLLNGESNPCDTYLNDVLSAKKHFQCTSLEIWSLQYD